MKYIAISILMLACFAAILTLEEPVENSDKINREAVEQITSEETQSTKQEPKKEVKQDVKTAPAEPAVTWRDNPNDCDQETQYILADTFACKDRPVQEKVERDVSLESTPTVAEPTPAPVAVSYPTGSCESYRSLLAQYSGWNVETMLYAMSKESSCNTNAVGDAYVIGGIYAPSCGLLQVRTLAGRPSCEALKNPATNIATAYDIYLSQGYRAWSVLH